MPLFRRPGLSPRAPVACAPLRPEPSNPVPCPPGCVISNLLVWASGLARLAEPSSGAQTCRARNFSFECTVLCLTGSDASFLAHSRTGLPAFSSAMGADAPKSTIGLIGLAVMGQVRLED